MAGAGFVDRAITRLLTKPWTVTAVEALSPHFRIIDFSGEGSFSPGDKVEIKLDGGLVKRTYTPISIAEGRGHARIVAYCHGEGPGNAWVRSAASGDVRPVFGPRASLNLDGLGTACVLFGDETSLGLAVALVQARAATDLRLVIEATYPDEVRSVLAHFGIGCALVIERREGGEHHPAIRDAILDTRSSEPAYLLTGCAPSIRFVRRLLKSEGVGASQMRAKAYWAPGKRGLD